jgi:tetrahydromethanopterin S-methyltransferase subunit D
MKELIPELLRAAVTTTSNTIIMGILLQPKYSKKVTSFVMLAVLSMDLVTAIYCYVSGNLTMLAKLDIDPLYSPLISAGCRTLDYLFYGGTGC